MFFQCYFQNWLSWYTIRFKIRPFERLRKKNWENNTSFNSEKMTDIKFDL